MQDQRTIALARAAAPRIQARQLLSTQPLLGTSIRAIAQLAESPVDARIARFVADACDDMHVLEAAQRRLTTIEEATAAQAVRHSANVLYELLRELEDWLEHCGTLVLPELTRVPLYIPGTVEWPLPRSATTTTILTCEHIWVARAWTLIHMCYVRISDALLGSGTHDTVVHGIDGACGTIAGEGDRVPQLHARLNTSSRLLLDLAPFLMGLTDEFGCARTTPVLQDTGLLIVQYPLWTIGQSKFGPSPATKREASELLGFIEEQLRVVDRVT
ncbi:hypothetical protein B0A55_04618 [Friedmanniomyces simplex]|uniref:Uncharacterized protein n=1 Tax=Friedmanniomyces simplex TaxID=329884 RepID=A0A4U0XKA8_9PEZI|nr:hypothetical protein B0A55_04618 [Friedmanniomyces simplex]